MEPSAQFGIWHTLSKVGQVVGLVLLIVGYVLVGFEMVFFLPPWSWQLIGALTIALSLAYIVNEDRGGRDRLAPGDVEQIGAHPDDWEWTDEKGHLQIPPKLRLDMVAPDQGAEGSEPATFNSHTIDRLGEVIAVAISAMEGLGVMMASFLDRMGRNPDDNVHRFGRLMRQTVQEPMGGARAALERLRGSDDGAAMISALGVAYGTYLEARSWLPESSTAAGRTYFIEADYGPWHRADEEFRRDLARARGAKSLAALDQLIRNVEQAQEIHTLEDPPSTFS